MLSAYGEVVRREPENVNPNIPTGEIELQVAEVTALAESETPPFPIDEDTPVDEMIRLRHRMLDLRRQGMRDALILRDAVIRTMRETLAAEDFLEIETPILTRSTPEGARDFLVPNRREPGSWYALPQSPQLFKQLLMMSGYERYYQIARCFRDEDTRADRQAEFTQLDVEMGFVEEDDVIELMERVMSRVFEVAGAGIPAPPWERVPFDEAMDRYGSDRPDRRFGLEIVDVSDALRGSDFKVFESVLGAGGVVRAHQRRQARDVALRAGRSERGRPAPRRQGRRVGDRRGGRLVALADRQVPRARSARPRPGRCWARRRATSCCSSPTRATSRRARWAGCGSSSGGASGSSPRARTTSTGSSTSRCSSAPRRGGRRCTTRSRRPRAPSTDPGAMRSRGYDLIMDGSELGGGSIRINTPEVQREVFKVIGMSEEEADSRFGFLLEALRYGAPPHGGIAFGIDRVVAVLGGRESIRDVIAFPKTATGQDPLTGAPAPIDDRQLRELGLRLR